MEPVDPLEEDARELLAAYRRERPGQHGRVRNWPAVRARVETRASAQPRRPWSYAWWFGGLAFALAAAVLLLTHALFVAWQATHVVRASAPEASDVASEPAPRALPTAAPTPVVAPAPMAVPAPPVIAPAPVQRPRPVAPPSDPTPSVQDLDQEVVLVAAARTALSSRLWTKAIAQLDEHARRFPSGALAEERSALRAMAACLSDAADARTTVLGFNSRYPGSPYHRDIKAACSEGTVPPRP